MSELVFRKPTLLETLGYDWQGLINWLEDHWRFKRVNHRQIICIVYKFAPTWKESRKHGFFHLGRGYFWSRFSKVPSIVEIFKQSNNDPAGKSNTVHDGIDLIPQNTMEVGRKSKNAHLKVLQLASSWDATRIHCGMFLLKTKWFRSLKISIFILYHTQECKSYGSKLKRIARLQVISIQKNQRDGWQNMENRGSMPTVLIGIVGRASSHKMYVRSSKLSENNVSYNISI